MRNPSVSQTLRIWTVASRPFSATDTLSKSPQALRVRRPQKAPCNSRSACQCRAKRPRVSGLMRRGRMKSRAIAAQPVTQLRTDALPRSRRLVHAANGAQKKSRTMRPLLVRGAQWGYLPSPEASFAAFFLSPKLIFKTFLKAAMSRMSSPRSSISTRMASCSWASS